MSELEKAARKCVFDELCVWCCKRVYTHCEYRAETKDEPICKEGKVVHAKFIAGAQWQANQSPWISVKERLPESNEDLYITLDTNMNPPGCGVCDFDMKNERWIDNRFEVVYPTHWMEILE